MSKSTLTEADQQFGLEAQAGDKCPYLPLDHVGTSSDYEINLSSKTLCDSSSVKVCGLTIESCLQRNFTTSTKGTKSRLFSFYWLQ